jgi:hypothetical protein
MVKKSVSIVVKVFTLLLSVLLLATITVGAASACSSGDCDKKCSDDISCYKQCFVYLTAICDDNKWCEDDNKWCEDDNKCEISHPEVNHCKEHGEHHDRCDDRCKDHCEENGNHDRCKEHGNHHDRCDDRCRDRC